MLSIPNIRDFHGMTTPIVQHQIGVNALLAGGDDQRHIAFAGRVVEFKSAQRLEFQAWQQVAEFRKDGRLGPEAAA